MTALEARDPAERVELLIRLTERLTGLLERETALFEARTPQKAQDFAQEKSELATIYRRETAGVAKDPSLVRGAPEARRHALAEATSAFHLALEANRRAGEALRVLAEGIVRSVAEEVGRMQSANAGYGPGASAPRAASAGQGVALSQTV